ncbi:cysteine desulfurase [Streptococcus agalactiae]|nr:cysteine desulfurase [Streptococcus agalactiae]
MAFEKEINLRDCNYIYTISPNIKKYTLRDTTFTQNRLGNYELERLLETVPNSGDGFPLKITINKELSGFKILITDKSGIRIVNICKYNDNKIIKEKFYLLI